MNGRKKKQITVRLEMKVWTSDIQLKMGLKWIYCKRVIVMEEHMFQGTIAALNQLVKSVENWSYD